MAVRVRRAGLAARKHTVAVAEDARQAEAAMLAGRAERLDAAVAVLTGNLALWTHRGQLPELDAYLSKVRVRRQTGSLPQYKDFTDAIKAASLVLRTDAAPFAEGSRAALATVTEVTHDEPAAVVPAEPAGEMWPCPQCGHVFDEAGVEHECVPVAPVAEGPSLITSPAVLTQPGEADGWRLLDREPRHSTGQLPANLEDRLGALFGETGSGDEDQAATSPSIPAAPEDGPHDPALDEAPPGADATGVGDG